MPLSVRAIKELIREHNLGISPRRMGQHFLLDHRILQRIAGTLEASPQDQILEIGAGLGALTEALLETGARVTAVERDKRFAGVLAQRFADSENLKVLHADILRVDCAEIAGHHPGSLLVAGNIPYSITGMILEHLLRHRAWIKRVALTLQKEVAQRIVAAAGTKAYSSLSLLVQVAFKPAIRFSIHPNAFYPQPEVTSAVLLLEPLVQPAIPPDQQEPALRLIRLLFTHRRKTLLNALAIADLDLSKEEAQRRLAAAGIDPGRRPETLSLQEVAALSRTLGSFNSNA